MTTLSLPQISHAPKPTKKPNGILLYQGPSNFNGKPIVVIATGIARGSRNVKTGKMIQVWIIADSGKTTIQSHKDGDDESCCGDCKHRHFGSCYVNLGQGVAHIYDAHLRGRYPAMTEDSIEKFRGKFVRFGAYGDPAAVPMHVWEPLLAVCKGHTAYTHQWHRGNKEYQSFCMASCDTESEVASARRMGWRPFHVRLQGTPLAKRTYECPATPEGGSRMTCIDCMACQGGELKHERMPTPSVVVHGTAPKLLRFERGLKLIAQKKKYRGVNLGDAA